MGDKDSSPIPRDLISMGKLTLLNAILLGALVVLTLLFLAGDTLNALIVVVLVGGALGGVGALWR